MVLIASQQPAVLAAEAQVLSRMPPPPPPPFPPPGASGGATPGTSVSTCVCLYVYAPMLLSY